MEIQFFDKSISVFIDSLEKTTRAKVLRIIDLLEQFGFQIGMPHSKPLKGGLFELRIRGVQEVRIIYTLQNSKIILLHGFIKKTNQISTRDFSIAKAKKT